MHYGENMNYKIKTLTLGQTAEIYKHYMHLHFPKEEIKPLKNIQRMWENGAYQAFGMYEEKNDTTELIGYAFCAMASDCRMILLDYLAIVEKYRGQGMGGIFLKEMRQCMTEVDGILIETEDIDFASNEEERQIRKKRDAFYERNHVVRTQIKSKIFSVHFANWQLPVTGVLSDAECKRNLEEIYKIMIPGAKNKMFVKIEL